MVGLHVAGMATNYHQREAVRLASLVQRRRFGRHLHGQDRHPEGVPGNATGGSGTTLGAAGIDAPGTVVSLRGGSAGGRSGQLGFKLC